VVPVSALVPMRMDVGILDIPLGPSTLLLLETFVAGAQTRGMTEERETSPNMTW
jgi:hypothetical protein